MTACKPAAMVSLNIFIILQYWNVLTRTDRHEGALRDRPPDLQEATAPPRDAIMQDGPQGTLTLPFVTSRFISFHITSYLYSIHYNHRPVVPRCHSGATTGTPPRHHTSQTTNSPGSPTPLRHAAAHSGRAGKRVCMRVTVAPCETCPPS